MVLSYVRFLERSSSLCRVDEFIPPPPPPIHSLVLIDVTVNQNAVLASFFFGSIHIHVLIDMIIVNEMASFFFLSIHTRVLIDMTVDENAVLASFRRMNSWAFRVRFL